MKKIVIGIDQSYENTGISVAVDGQLKSMTSIRFKECANNSAKREVLRRKLIDVILKMLIKRQKYDCELIIIIERIRLQSQGFVNIDYIKSIGALNSVIVDCANTYGIKVFSVDTRSWKSTVVGTSKPMSNSYGVPEEKWPTVRFLLKQGWKDQLLYEVSDRCTANVWEKDGKKYRFNNDAADSGCIALYGFAEKQLLEEEH